ncbi:MAG: hypothetical protein NT062_36415 [Proteobacteria bacterium]|nr:hypothetical protein [Pseudomonadota bacterium]
MAELVANRDPVIVELAAKHETTASLIEWIRSLPQRDDDGDPNDGPKVAACSPPQRLRIPAIDANCVERAATFQAVAEFIDPKPVRQLATLGTPIGLHTFPVENGAPIILDPRVPRNCLDAGVALARQAPVPIEARDAIEWTAQLAEAGAANVRNGPSRVRRARNAIMTLVDDGVAPADADTFDAIGWLLALAERVARRYGAQAVAIVRTTAQAIADLADESLARTQRNLALEIGGVRLAAPRWLTTFGSVAGRIGLSVGATALRSKLDTLGIGDDMVGLVENELNREGMSLGRLARPQKLATFASMSRSRAA